ncbi:MAG: hypothetical protein BWY82_03031 [Verrucomicrobia bacterium ADurb.Bin474]|nr:MAG: hypothetical protein BWY82_03031 [Verrucomicrobia bacterium ADurb.Bin474]
MVEACGVLRSDPIPSDIPEDVVIDFHVSGGCVGGQCNLVIGAGKVPVETLETVICDRHNRVVAEDEAEAGVLEVKEITSGRSEYVVLYDKVAVEVQAGGPVLVHNAHGFAVVDRVSANGDTGVGVDRIGPRFHGDVHAVAVAVPVRWVGIAGAIIEVMDCIAINEYLIAAGQTDPIVGQVVDVIVAQDEVISAGTNAGGRFGDLAVSNHNGSAGPDLDPGPLDGCHRSVQWETPPDRASFHPDMVGATDIHAIPDVEADDA